MAVRKEWGRTQRDTYFGQANASGSSRTVADLQISGLGDTTLQDCIDRVRMWGGILGLCPGLWTISAGWSAPTRARPPPPHTHTGSPLCRSSP